MEHLNKCQLSLVIKGRQDQARRYHLMVSDPTIPVLIKEGPPTFRLKSHGRTSPGPRPKEALTSDTRRVA